MYVCIRVLVINNYSKHSWADNIVGFQAVNGFCYRNTKALCKSHGIQRWGLAASPMNSLSWPTPFLSLSCVLSQVPLLSELPSLLPSSLLCFCSWYPHEGHVTLLYTLDLSFYPLCLVFPCVLIVHNVEEHIHFYHCRRGKGMTSRKILTHPSLPEMKESKVGLLLKPGLNRL